MINNQYRTGVYYVSQEDLPTIKSKSLEEVAKYDKPLGGGKRSFTD